MSQVRRDLKKVVILAVLLVILVVVGVSQTGRRAGPSSAAGAVTPARHVGVGPSAGAGGPQGAGRAGAAKLNGPTEDDEDLPDLSKQAVNRDLFLVSPLHFPPEEKAKAVPQAPVAENPAAKREAEVRILQAQAKALTLQSTMVGAVPTAIVNGQVLRVGEWISGFQVVEIAARSCTIEKQGARLILELAN
jgi:hypothetical protein